MKRLFCLILISAIIVPAVFSQPINPPQRAYDLTFVTADKKDAGTDAKISIKLYGILNTSDFKEVNDYIHGNAFERNNFDECRVSFPDCGVIWKIEIKSDMSKTGPDWDCAYIKVGSRHPNRIPETSFTVNECINSEDSFPVSADNYQPPTIQDMMETTQYYYKAYASDNLDGLSRVPANQIDNYIITETMESQNVQSSQIGELTGGWSVNLIGSLNMGIDYTASWTNFINTITTSAINSTQFSTTYSVDLSTDPHCYLIKICSQAYHLDYKWTYDSFKTFLVRSLTTIPEPNYPKTFYFGPDYPKVKWSDFSFPLWNNAIRNALGESYDNRVQNLQDQGYLERPTYNRSPILPRSVQEELQRRIHIVHPPN
jgi:hypothetical protein